MNEIPYTREYVQYLLGSRPRTVVWFDVVGTVQEHVCALGRRSGSEDTHKKSIKMIQLFDVVSKTLREVPISNIITVE